MAFVSSPGCASGPVTHDSTTADAPGRPERTRRPGPRAAHRRGHPRRDEARRAGAARPLPRGGRQGHLLPLDGPRQRRQGDLQRPAPARVPRQDAAHRRRPRLRPAHRALRNAAPRAHDRGRAPRRRPPRDRRGPRGGRPRVGPPPLAGQAPAPFGQRGRIAARPGAAGVHRHLRGTPAHLRGPRLVRRRALAAGRRVVRARVRQRLPWRGTVPSGGRRQGARDAAGPDHPPHPRRGARRHAPRRPRLLRLDARRRLVGRLAGAHRPRRARGRPLRGRPAPVPAPGRRARHPAGPAGRAARGPPRHRRPLPQYPMGYGTVPGRHGTVFMPLQA